MQLSGNLTAIAISLSSLARATFEANCPHVLPVFVTRVAGFVNLNVVQFFGLALNRLGAVVRTTAYYFLPISHKYSYRECRSRNAITHEAAYAFHCASYKAA